LTIIGPRFGEYLAGFDQDRWNMNGANQNS
jgi:hypothetical protein